MAIVSDRLEQIASVLAELGVGNGDGNGGSQPGTPRIIQTAVDFTDFSTGTEGETVELFTPQVGTAILDWWVDPDTYIPWDDTGSESDGFMYQGPAVFDPNTLAGSLGEILRTAGNPNQPPCLTNETIGGNRYTLAGLQLDTNPVSGICITQSANPVAIYWYRNGVPGDNPPTAGHCDIYFLVADPPLATS